jgi:hypothetical protein
MTVSQVSPFGFGRRLRIRERPMHHQRRRAQLRYRVLLYGRITNLIETGKADPTTSSWLCDPSHRSIAMCNLFASDDLNIHFYIGCSRRVQILYRLISSKPHAPEVDWCPMPIFPVGIDCTDASASPTRLPRSYVGEAYGSKSMCVNFELDIAK